MQILTDSIEIHAPPEEAFLWFLDIEKHYRLWHLDHIGWSWMSGEPFQIGSRAVIQEILHGEHHKLTCVTTHVIKDELIEYTFAFPFSLIASGGSFEFTKNDTGFTFRATLTFRFAKLFSKFFRKEMNAVIRHMREEGENLKRILER
jgi:hypothetical protein